MLQHPEDSVKSPELLPEHPQDGENASTGSPEGSQDLWLAHMNAKVEVLQEMTPEITEVPSGRAESRDQKQQSSRRSSHKSKEQQRDYFPVPTSARRLRLYLPDQVVEMRSEGQDGRKTNVLSELARCLTPFRLRVLLGVFECCWADERTNYTWFNPNRFCDLFGFAKNARGQHQTRNRRRVMEAIRYLCETCIEIHNPDTDEWDQVFVLNLLRGARFRYDPDGKKVPIAGRLFVTPVVYRDFANRRGRMFTWANSEVLTINEDRHALALKIYAWLCGRWRMDWVKRVSKEFLFARNVGAMILEAGIPISARNERRLIEKVHNELDFLRDELDLLRDWWVQDVSGEPRPREWYRDVPLSCWEKTETGKRQAKTDWDALKQAVYVFVIPDTHHSMLGQRRVALPAPNVPAEEG